MTKKRKLHQLKGTINQAWLGASKSKPWKNQPLYCLEVTLLNLFRGKQETNLYAFPNLLSKGIWNTLEQRDFKNKTYLFFCEKRVRGWRLKDWEEIENINEQIN